MLAKRLTSFVSSRPLLGALKHFSTYPKHEVVNMPALSPTMTAGTISSWKVKIGDKCVPGDTIAEIETDKASIAFESQEEFYVAKILVEAGSEVKCGNPIMVSVDDESSVPAFANYQITAAAVEPKKEEVKVEPPKAAPPSPPKVEAPVIITPPVSVSVAVPTPVTPPVVATPPTPASTPNAFYSVSVSTSSSSTSPLEKKIKSNQEKYAQKYGRASPPAVESKTAKA